MASPQPDEFTRISNELLEAVLATNFTKRQLNIILLVIRLSYGCGKKHVLLRPSEFSLAGIYKGDIKRELALLAGAGVLTVDGEKVALNKDYDAWRVGPAQTWDRGRFKEVLRRNLIEAGVNKNTAAVGKTPTGHDGRVGATPTQDSGKVSVLPTVPPAPVGKTPTQGLVKYQPQSSQNTNPAVSKTLTDQTLPPYSPMGSKGAERNLKKLKEKLKKDLPRGEDLHHAVPGCGQSEGVCLITNRETELTSNLPPPAPGEGTTPLVGDEVTGGNGTSSPGQEYRAREREGAKTAPGALNSGPAPTVGQAPAYTSDFLRFWAAYPRQKDKGRAYRCWQARLKEGLTASDLVAAAANYAAYCRKHRTEERYIKHAATFLGPDRPCSEWLDQDTDQAGAAEKEKRKAFIRSLYLS